MIASLLILLSSRPPAALVITASTVNPLGPISPYVYGSNEGNWAKPTRHLTFGRQGGNRMSAYNWETNASNAGSDYQHQNDGYLLSENTPGEYPRRAVAEAHANNASFLVTIPMTGYVSADKNADGDVNKTPNYLDVRFHRSLPAKGGAFTYPPNTNDKFVYQDEFAAWLESKFPNRKPGANIWYSLDNEPDLWSGTHPRIHPNATTYAEIIQKSLSYSKAIKAVAPKTLIFGPASYGWGGYVNFQNAPDAGGRDFLEFYLDQMKEAEVASGKRLLDVLDIHWYPEVYGDGKRIVEQLSTPGIAAARMQATRSLWDPTYVEKSWISDSIGKKPISLIPRMMEKISKHYPGTKLAFSEYQYGGGNDISGAIAEADALGIFGREGVFAAALWPLAGDAAFVDAAFNAFRNYDGQGSHFGDQALRVSNPDPEELGVYGSSFSNGTNRVVFVVTNQSEKPIAAILAVGGNKSTKFRSFSLTAKEPNLRPNEFVFRQVNSYQLTLPARSVNVLELD